MKGAIFCSLFLLSTYAVAQSGTEKLLQEAERSPALESNLHILTDEIGGRVPGTPAMIRAVQWGVDAFKAAGADSVRTEAVQLASSWQEGDTQLDVVSPIQFKLQGVSLTWTAPSASPMDGLPVVDVGMGSAEEFQKAESPKGAVVLVHSALLQKWEDLFGEYLGQGGILKAAQSAGAVAVAFISTREHDLLYRHIGSFNDHINSFPQFLLAREDGERLARLLADGKKLRLRYSIPNHVGRAFLSDNVVAEIRGAEKPDEYVVLGAHLDSWALGTGALDNGCNAALVIEAMRAINAAGLRPRRTIRFVLFTGEEEGLIGSRAYVRDHRLELSNTIAMLTWDEGTGKTTGFSLGGRKDIAAQVSRLLDPIRKLGPFTLTTDAFVGTDNMDFLLEGIPTLVANQEEANYLVNYHASSDTYDKVDFAQLRKHIAVAAFLAYAIADAPERLGPRQSRAEIEQLMKETQLDEQLRAFEVWSDWESRARGRTR